MSSHHKHNFALSFPYQLPTVSLFPTGYPLPLFYVEQAPPFQHPSQ
jgi:hypothetical protein